MELTPLDKNAGLKVSGLKNENLSDFDFSTNLKKFGCLWFSGTELSTEEFLAFSDKWSDQFYSYRGGAFSRDQVGENETLLSVTGHSRGFPVPLHGELHYHPSRPELLWFYCLSPALIGGETTVADGEEFFKLLKKSTQEFLLETELLYIRTHEREDWESIYQSTSKEDVLKHCLEIGISPEFDSDILKTKFKNQGIKTSPYTGQKTFLNNILPMAALEDINIKVSLVRDVEGNPLPKKVLSDIKKTAKKVTLGIKWKKGDFLIVDNRRFLHGRKAFVDKKRQIAVRMSNLSI